MKVRRVDQGDNPAQNPCLVMAGILVDALRLHGTRKASAVIFDIVQRLFIVPSWPPTRGDAIC